MLDALMTITPHDRNSYLVEGSSGKPPYLVDMEEYDGRGWCDCNDFKYRVQPAWERSLEATPCKHIEEVMKHRET